MKEGPVTLLNVLSIMASKSQVSLGDGGLQVCFHSLEPDSLHKKVKPYVLHYTPNGGIPQTNISAKHNQRYFAPIANRFWQRCGSEVTAKGSLACSGPPCCCAALARRHRWDGII